MVSKKDVRKLLADLRYFQMQVRIDVNSLKKSRRKCQEIGARLRELQKESAGLKAGRK